MLRIHSDSITDAATRNLSISIGFEPALKIV